MYLEYTDGDKFYSVDVEAYGIFLEQTLIACNAATEYRLSIPTRTFNTSSGENAASISASASDSDSAALESPPPDLLEQVHHGATPHVLGRDSLRQHRPPRPQRRPRSRFAAAPRDPA